MFPDLAQLLHSFWNFFGSILQDNAVNIPKHLNSLSLKYGEAAAASSTIPVGIAGAVVNRGRGKGEGMSYWGLSSLAAHASRLLTLLSKSTCLSLENPSRAEVHACSPLISPGSYSKWWGSPHKMPPCSEWWHWQILYEPSQLLIRTEPKRFSSPLKYTKIKLFWV